MSMENAETSNTLVLSEAKLSDALNLLRRTLRKLRIDPMNVVIMIPDGTVREKMKKAFTEQFFQTNAAYYPSKNQFIMRWGGITIIGPDKMAETPSNDPATQATDPRDVGA
jgi:hypothetical protein